VQRQCPRRGHVADEVLLIVRLSRLRNVPRLAPPGISPGWDAIVRTPGELVGLGIGIPRMTTA